MITYVNNLTSVAFGRTILLMDNFDAHKSPELRARLDILGILAYFIPPKCTDSLQPMYSHVIKCFKDKFRNRYVPWLESIVRSTERARNPSKEQICAWILEAWNEVPASLIIGSFQRSGIEFSGSNEPVLPQNQTDIRLDILVSAVNHVCQPSSSNTIFYDCEGKNPNDDNPFLVMR